MMASLVGLSSARPRMVGAVCGVRQEASNMSSASMAAPMRSFSVSAGPSPTWVSRSPQNKVPVVSS